MDLSCIRKEMKQQPSIDFQTLFYNCYKSVSTEQNKDYILCSQIQVISLINLHEIIMYSTVFFNNMEDYERTNYLQTFHHTLNYNTVSTHNIAFSLNIIYWLTYSVKVFKNISKPSELFLVMLILIYIWRISFPKTISMESIFTASSLNTDSLKK